MWRDEVLRDNLIRRVIDPCRRDSTTDGWKGPLVSIGWEMLYDAVSELVKELTEEQAAEALKRIEKNIRKREQAHT